MRKNSISAKMKKILAVACASALVLTSIPANYAFATETNVTEEEKQQEENNDQQTDGNGNQQPDGNGNQQTDGNDNQQPDGNDNQQIDGNDNQQPDGNDDQQSGGNDNQQTDGNGNQQPDGNGNQQTDGNTNPDNNNTNKEGEEPVQQDPEVEKKIEIDFGIDDDASEKNGAEYTKLVFKASAKDTSSLETEISKIEYELIDKDNNTVESGEIGNESIVIESKDLKKKNKAFTLKIIVTDADNATSEDTKEIKFYYQKPTAEIVINTEASETLENESEKYLKLVFGATSTVDEETELKKYYYTLKRGDEKVEGTFAANESVEINAQNLNERGDYTLTVTAEDQNEESSEEVSKTVYMAKDDTSPEIKYTVRSTSGNPLLDLFDIAQTELIYKVEVTDESGIESVKYQIFNSVGEPDPEEELVFDGAEFAEFKVKADKKGHIKLWAKDINNNESDPIETNPLIVENKKPSIILTCDNKDVVAKSHTFKVTALDEPENEYSGLRKITWAITNESGTVINDNSGEIFAADMPEELSDLVKAIEEETIETGSNLDGQYTFSVNAEDWCGNPATDSLKVTYDNTAPVVEFETNDAFKTDPADQNKIVANNDGVVTIKISDPKGENETQDHSFTYSVMCDDTVEIAKDVQATGEANVQIKLSDLNLIDGDHVITVVAEDAAGNKTEEEETTKFAFAVDNTNPVIEASVSGERAEADGFLLYNKQSIEKLSGGVTVKFAVKDVHPVKEGWKLRYKKNGIVGEWEDITLDNDYTYSLTLSEDGTYENFELKGLDLVGNGSKYSAENIKEIGSETELAFTVESMIIKIVSCEPAIKISLNDDNKDSAYHNEGAFTIHIDSNDNITESKITGFKIIATGSKGSKEKTHSSEGSEPNKTIDVTFEEDEISGICEAEDTIEISVYAVTDFGNSTQKLSAAAGFENAIELTDSNDAVNGKFYYDIKAPEITITYSSENTAYIYKEAPDGYPNITYSAYYAGSVTASFEMEDQNCSDEGLYIDGSESGTSKNIVCEDEVNVFSVYGEDKAGNPANVKEVWSDPDNKVNDRTGEEVVGIVGTFSEGHGKENEYTVRVATVIDKKGPQVSIVADSRSDDDTLEAGIRRYYNSNFKVVITATDELPLDKDLIKAYKEYNGNLEVYDQVHASTAIDVDASTTLDPDESEEERFTITFTAEVTADSTSHNSDGVYRFYITGTDKAGNPVTVASTSQGPDENQLVGKEDASIGNYLISQPKVLDTVAPLTELTAFVNKEDDNGETTEKDIYKLILQENNKKVTVYDPFQKNVASYLKFAKTDKSPSKLSFVVKSTNSTNGETTLVADYGTSNENQYPNKFSTAQKTGGEITRVDKEVYTINSAKQIITMSGIEIKDRAGNTVVLEKSNELIFDDDFSVEDTLAPTATIEATSDITHRNADGRDLFNYAPTIRITVTDPGKGENSSGLKNVNYVVLVDGREVDSDSVSYTDYIEPGEAITVGEDGTVVTNNSLTYEKEFIVELSESYQTNDIVIKVNAVDNSGNAMEEATYKCGIDTVGPEIVVSYDNNSARNGKYFKAKRTATITVTDRNIANNNIPISTQVSVPGSFDYLGGSGNGANDQWRKRLNYSTDGDYTLRLGNCTDALGNKGTVKYTGTAPNEFIVDLINPTIKVDFDNNSVQNGKYYKDPRNATVTVTDHNFSAADTRIDTQVTPGGFRNESRDVHKANVYYGSDGVYTMYVTSTDLAGNVCTQPVRIDEFVIDRTAPVISVTFDNNDAQNGKYYKDPRTATVSIHEHNFRESDVNIAQTADIQQGSVSAPGVGGFGGGGDDHSASINYSQDGNYTIEVNYSDLAGNPAQVVRVDEFVIDQTPPTLKFIMPDELKGISQIFQGDIAPQIEFGDINMTRGMASIELKGMKANSDVLKLLEDSFENYKGTVRYENLKKVRESDDIYTATAVVTDLAGNKVEKTITFSVNRFGSTYDYNKDDFTTKLMGYYFTNAPGDVILREVNVNQLTDHKLTLYKDGDNWVLVEGKDYKFEERQVNGHYEYIYTILAKNFEEEGNYNIIASSKDKAANTNSNSAVKENDGSNEVPLRFAVDKTAPTNLITGVDMSKNKFTESQIVLNIEPQDNMNAVARFRVRVLDRKGNVLQEFEISGKELAEYFEENNGIYQLTVNQNTGWQTIEVLTTDAAGNESVDYSIENNTAYRVLVTPNLFYQYIYRLPLVGATLAIIGGLIFFWLWKRKKDEEEKEAA